MSDEFFQAMNQASQVDQDAATVARFEEACIKRLMAGTTHASRFRQLVTSYRKHAKRHALDFDWFAQAYPSMGATFFAHRLKHVFDIRWGELFGSGFNKLPWVVKYQELASGIGLDLRRDWVVMFFGAPHADKASTMVLHNHVSELALAPDISLDTAITRIVRKTGRGVTYVLEPLDSFKTVIGLEFFENNFNEFC